MARDDLEAMRLLLAIVPPAKDNFKTIDRRLSDLQGFVVVSQYVRQHVLHIQKTQIHKRLMQMIRTALAQIAKRYVGATCRSHDQVFSGIHHAIQYQSFFVRFEGSDLAPVLIDVASLHDEKASNFDIEKHLEKTLSFACLLKFFQGQLLVALDHLKTAAEAEPVLRQHLLFQKFLS